jgi:glycosyltransferase involved in cell wall biosynthesis
MPALNEEQNVRLALQNTLACFADFNIHGEVIVINDGSTDRTRAIVEEMMATDKRIRLVNHDRPMGIGASFWDGVDQAQSEIVSMFPGDNENDPWEILRYLNLLEQVDMVIPFVFNKEARSIFRNLVSFLYRFIINTTFRVNFNYTNGTVLYRRLILKELKSRSSGFFFQTDILIRSAKRGYLFAEVPYRLGMRSTGVSKAVSFPSLVRVAKGYLRLVQDFYGANSVKDTATFAQGSRTSERYSQENKNYKITQT